MKLRILLTTLALWALLALTGPAAAAAEVELLDTWPRGDDVVLADGQNFYVRLRYRSDEPVGIWARPFWRGAPANAGSHPSARYEGEGEVVGWFFLMDGTARVDEIRVQVGNGYQDPVLLRLPVNVRRGSPLSTPTPPDWVAALEAENQRRRAAGSAPPREPRSLGWRLAAAPLMLVFALLGTAPGAAWPLYGVLRWRGIWRIAAALPLAALAFVVLRLVVDTFRDPTSHNLWPFELVFFDLLAVGFMLVVFVGKSVWTRMNAR
ncbi:hypothetical protein [Arenimonas composti]|uniref:DUF4436 domain-containing protein n=1 Tax=Arenimonas composti TR7-09 = DSM 18010 TaxID=1121013 RepID=A0A091BF07_9GAMM|nr:hypothetical protein [Arenimonas composti]KFN50122.1 hypothetical protein P873_08080 [Arenimonas composti TR7-09 = DSM 18010]